MGGRFELGGAVGGGGRFELWGAVGGGSQKNRSRVTVAVAYFGGGRAVGGVVGPGEGWGVGLGCPFDSGRRGRFGDPVGGREAEGVEGGGWGFGVGGRALVGEGRIAPVGLE